LPNLDRWINKNEATNNFENHLLSIRAELQQMIHPNSHPTYNDRHQKIIEMIDWTLEKYKTTSNTQKINEQVIIDNIIEELAKKRDIAINKKNQALLKDETWKYSEEEDTIDYIIFLIQEGTGKLY
jgi:RPA family protein